MLQAPALKPPPMVNKGSGCSYCCQHLGCPCLILNASSILCPFTVPLFTSKLPLELAYHDSEQRHRVSPETLTVHHYPPPHSIRGEQLPPISSLKSRNRAVEKKAGVNSSSSISCPCQHFMSKSGSRKQQLGSSQC